MGAPPRPRRRLRGRSPIFTVRPLDEHALTGDLENPSRILQQPVVARLRQRRDRPGALVALEDGRYAVTGPLLIAGSREDVTSYARRRVNTDDPDQRAWLQTIVGALAIDIFDAAPPRSTATAPASAPKPRD
jgi:cell volume regulation protein A